MGKQFYILNYEYNIYFPTSGSAILYIILKLASEKFTRELDDGHYDS